MGDGLKRAFAAAARTRADASLTSEMRRFLEALPANGAPVPPRRLRLVATDAQNVARQRCRRFGYARMALDDTGLSGWQITKAGKSALEAPALPRERRES